MSITRGNDAESVADSVWVAVVTAVGSEAGRLLDLHGGDAGAIRAELTEAVDARLREALGGEPDGVCAAVEPVLDAVATHLADGARMGADRELVTAGVVYPLLVHKAGLLTAVRAAAVG
jgi:hypothetical protein